MSLAADIRAAATAAVAGLTLPGTPAVRARKRPAYKAGDPAAGVVVVSGIDLAADPLTPEAALAVAGRYGVAVTAIRPNQSGEASDGTIEGWVAVIRAALFRPNPLPAVPAVADVRLVDRPWFAATGLEKNYDVAQLALVYETIEQR
jgi:hypothetical protein